MTRIWHISDTHTYQSQLNIPENIDLVIHTGDASNYRDPMRNESEMWGFLEWYAGLEIPNKVFVAGNHDTSVERGLIKKLDIENLGICYLFNDDITVNGLKIWGSPHTPTFGDWAFMKARNTINRVWESIPDDTDIIAVHGPPKGILDITNRRDNLQEQCGDGALLKASFRIKPKLVCFGHIHDCAEVYNSGIKHLAGVDTIFSNGACVTDGKRGVITSHGNVIEIKG